MRHVHLEQGSASYSSRHRRISLDSARVQRIPLLCEANPKRPVLFPSLRVRIDTRRCLYYGSLKNKQELSGIPREVGPGEYSQRLGPKSVRLWHGRVKEHGSYATNRRNIASSAF